MNPKLGMIVIPLITYSSNENGGNDDNHGGDNSNNMIFENGDIDFPPGNGNGEENNDANGNNLGQPNGGHVDNGFVLEQADDVVNTSDSDEYASAEANSEANVEIQNADAGYESDPLTPENYHHPVRFNAQRHADFQVSIPFNDPYVPYYP